MALVSTHSKAERKARRDKVVKLKARGLTVSEISEKLGITNGTTSYYLATLSPTSKASKGEERVKRPYHRHFSPIVIGSTTNGRGDKRDKEGSGNNLNNASLLDLLWARLTVEEKVQAIKGIKEADNG